MKRLIILYAGLLVLLPFLGQGQNVIQNGDLENCDGNVDCPILPNFNGQINRILGSWSRLGTPDWFSNDPAFYDPSDHFTCGSPMTAQSGAHFAGMYDDEGIVYDFGGPMPRGVHQLSLWVAPSQRCNQHSDNWGIEVYIDDQLFENKSAPCKGLKHNPIPVGRFVFPYDANDLGWRQVIVPFSVFGVSPLPQYIMVTGLRNEPRHAGDPLPSCTNYIYFDNMSLELDDCCPPHWEYQNTDDLPDLTSVENFIRAGFSVDAQRVEGAVFVNSGDDVLFEAGQEIRLEDGFHAFPGGDFHARIDNCNAGMANRPIFIHSPAINTGCGVGSLPFFMCNGTESLYTEVSGADWYEVQVFNRWGELGFEHSGLINSNQIFLWDGRFNGSIVDAPYVYVAQIRLRNCSWETPWKRFCILASSDCLLSGEINDAELYEGRINSNTGINIQAPPAQENTLNLHIAPNPNHGLFTLSMNTEVQQRYDVEVFNMLGKLILKTSSDQKQVTLDISQYPKGIYLVKVTSGQAIKVEEVVVQ